MASLTFTQAELEALAQQLQPFLTTVSPPPKDGGITPPPPPVVPPPPTTSGATISARWDSAPSQWAKWNFITAGETVALEAIYGVGLVANHIGWYHETHRLDGRMNADGTYDFVSGYTWWGAPQWERDTGGAADAKHAKDLTGGAVEIAPLA